MARLLQSCRQAVLDGNPPRARALAERALDVGHEPLKIIEKGFSPGIREAGRRWEAGEYFLPELAFAAEAMKAAMEVLQPALRAGVDAGTARGTVVIGTVQGDIHDIGKTLVATLLSAHGYDVVDLGANVEHERFVDAVREHTPAFLCMSALLTTTMPGQRRVIEMLGAAGLRDSIRVVVGGAPTSSSWASEIGADAHAANAAAAARTLEALG